MSGQRLDLLCGGLNGVRLVEASAGTGKTFAVCLLYLRLLLERGFGVQEILVVSFTKAATAELRERIRTRLAGALHSLRHPEETEPDPVLAELLARYAREGRDSGAMARTLAAAVADFDRSAIYTIHGFCKRVLDDEPFVTALPLALELQTDDTELCRGVLVDLYRRWLETAAPDAALAARLWDASTLRRLGRELKRRLAKPLAEVRFEQQRPAGAAVGAADEVRFLQARTLWQSERAQLIGRLERGREAKLLNGTRFTVKSIAEGAQQWDEVFAAPSLELASVAAPDKRRLDRYTRSAQESNGKRPTIDAHPFFELAGLLLAALEAREQRSDAAWAGLLRTVVEEGPAAVLSAKRARRVLAFDDLLAQLYGKLHDADAASAEALALSLRHRYPVALVDEFQDTDPQQYGIFRKVYGGTGDLFLVGDPKQAIYSFRNADLHVYFKAVEGADSVETLLDNQRSSGDYIEALNALFQCNPAAFALPQLRYHAVGTGKKRRPSFVESSASGAPLHCWSLSAVAEGGVPTLHEARRRAAQATAAEIARLLNEAAAGRAMHDGRPLRAGDMAVIVPTLVRGREVRAALAQLGVGAVEITRDSVYRTDEAEEIDRILVAVLQPSHAGLVRAALATALLGCKAAQIAALRTDEGALAAHCERFAHYRELWQRRGIGLMLRSLMLDYRVEATVLGGPLGERRMTNLRHLSELLHTAAVEHTTPEALLRWLQMARGEDTAVEAAQMRLESDRNLVQIVTIHAAKGLEYPIVFCPTLWDDFLGRDQDPGEAFEYHDPATGFVLDYREGDEHTSLAKEVRREERDAERLRLLYVALTRAVHRTYLVVGAYLSSGTTNAAGRTALQWLVTPGITRGEHRASKRDAAEIDAAWQALATACPHVRVEPLPLGAGSAVTSQGPAADQLVARAAPRALREVWRFGSYSGLIHGSSHEAAARDRDGRSQATETGTGLPDLAEDDILRFARGNGAGVCVHAVFEQADFTSSVEWPGVIESALATHPPGPPATADGHAQRARQLARMLRDVTTTVLPPGFALREVPVARRLVEWEFHLPSRQFDAGALSRLLATYDYPVPALKFAPLTGYLHGFVDLVAEHAGRYYVIDWKSNFLGATAADYASSEVSAAMAKDSYHLQHLLYTVALHRFLAQRVSGYDYERDIGGTLYLFVRGVRPDWPGAGVYFNRAPRRLIEDLSALFGDGGVPP